MNDKKKYGAIALALSLGGLLLAVSIEMIAQLLGHNALMPAYLVFMAFQMAGLVLGILSRQHVLGKTACITSAVLAAIGAVGLLLMLG